MTEKKSVTTDDARKQIHQHISFQERADVDGYRYCTKCGDKVMLITAFSTWRVDQEAFKSEEYTRDDDSIPEEVEVGEEITAHWCDNCQVITSLSFNSF